VTNEKTSNPAIEDQPPPIFVGGRRDHVRCGKTLAGRQPCSLPGVLSGKYMGTKPLVPPPDPGCHGSRFAEAENAPNPLHLASFWGALP
jgi:hypothetical protein